jgi:hypothetical protein
VRVMVIMVVIVMTAEREGWVVNYCRTVNERDSDRLVSEGSSLLCLVTWTKMGGNNW